MTDDTQDKTDVINYAKYVSYDLYLYQFSAILLGIDPKEVNCRVCDDPVSWSIYGETVIFPYKHKKHEEKFFEIYDALSNQIKNPCYSIRLPVYHLVESSLRNCYPEISQEKHKNFLKAVKNRFTNETPEFQKKHPLLSEFLGIAKKQPDSAETTKERNERWKKMARDYKKKFPDLTKTQIANKIFEADKVEERSPPSVKTIERAFQIKSIT